MASNRSGPKITKKSIFNKQLKIRVYLFQWGSFHIMKSPYLKGFLKKIISSRVIPYRNKAVSTSRGANVKVDTLY